MGVQGAVAVVLVAVGIVLAVMALVVVVSKATSARARSAGLAAMTRAQRRRAAAVVRRGGPVTGDKVVGVRALASAQADQGHVALLGGAGLALVAGALIFPWSPGLMPMWVRALFVAALVLQAMSALLGLRGVRRARRFLAAHPDPGAEVGVTR